MGHINIFGTKFAYPKGLRKSPGTNSHASCVAVQLAGKKHGSRAAARAAFTNASKECQGK